jgi:hypothetical protein
MAHRAPAVVRRVPAGGGEVGLEHVDVGRPLGDRRPDADALLAHGDGRRPGVVADPARPRPGLGMGAERIEKRGLDPRPRDQFPLVAARRERPAITVEPVPLRRVVAGLQVFADQQGSQLHLAVGAVHRQRSASRLVEREGDVGGMYRRT